jgi:hypothetical protein
VSSLNFLTDVLPQIFQALAFCLLSERKKYWKKRLLEVINKNPNCFKTKLEAVGFS